MQKRLIKLHNTHHPAEGMEIVDDSDDPVPDEQIEQVQQNPLGV